MPRLPDNKIVEERKIREYLLSQTHDVGKAKARYFINRGFSLLEWGAFQEALLDHGSRHEIASSKKTEYATNHVVRCTCTTPDGADPCIFTVWEDRGDGSDVRLITAYPAPKDG